MKLLNKVVVWSTILTLVVTFFSATGLQAETRPSAKEIPNGTLIIGTHLIALEALNMEILAVALKSADDSQKGEPRQIQTKVYYKSELNNGVWYDITGAESILDITLSSSAAVPNTAIDRLILSHWTKDDGVTIEFSTGKPVAIHILNSPENPTKAAELEAMKIERDVQQGKYEGLAKSKGNEEQLKAVGEKIRSIDQLFEQVTDPQVLFLGQLLDSFETFKRYLVGQKAPNSILSLAHGLKEKVLAEKDLLTYQILLKRANEGAKVASLLEDADLLNKYGTVINEIHNKLSQLASELEEREEGLVLGQMAGNLRKDITSSVKAGNHGAAYELLKKLIVIGNIQKGDITDGNQDLAQALLAEAKQRLIEDLKGKLAQGEPQGYKDAKDQGESASVLAGLRQKVLSQYEKELEELRDLQADLLKRIKDPNGQLVVLEQLDKELNNMLASLPQDDLTNPVADLLSDLIKENNGAWAKLKAGQSLVHQEKRSAMERLQSQRDKLQEEYLLAAEQGDFAAMAAKKQQLENLNQSLFAEQLKAANDYRGLLDALTELEASLAAAEGAAKGQLKKDRDEVLFQLAGLEPLLDDKAQAALKNLENTKGKLGKALGEHDLAGAKKVAGDLVDLLALIPESLMSDSQKEAQIKNALVQLGEKTDKLISQEVTGSMVPAYYLVLVEQNLKIYQPYLELDGEIYIPSRIVFESLGAKLTWQAKREHVVVQDPTVSLLLEYTINQELVYLNHRRVKLAKPVENFGGVTYLPLQLILDGYRLQWEMSNGVIYIFK